jgi:hypothetical protein
MSAAERQARRRKRVGKSINRRRRTLYKIANESETRKAKRARRAEILATVAERTKAATTALTSMSLPLANLIVLDPPWPHVNYSAETGSDRATDKGTEDAATSGFDNDALGERGKSAHIRPSNWGSSILRPFSTCCFQKKDTLRRTH